MLRGICQKCGFVGLIQPKHIFPEGVITLDVIDMEAPVEPKKLCLTCINTPNGVKSENQTHKRLPQVEYERR